MKQAALAALLAACLLAAPAARAGADSAHLAAVPLSRMDLPWWRARFNAKAAELRAGQYDLVFYGDSITQDWELAGPEPWRNFSPIWTHYYQGRHALNLGFKGDTTAHLLWRVENGEATGLHPKAVVVLIGANNFGRLRWPAGPTEQGVAKIVDELRARLPGAHILLLGVLPCLRGPWVADNTAALNHALAARYHGNQNVRFMDLSALFLTNGQVDATKFMDGHLTPPDPPLHPTAQTQAAMAAAMEPVLSQWLGDRPRAP